MAQISGVEHVYSTSSTGKASVTLRFFVGENRDQAILNTYNKLYSNLHLVPQVVNNWRINPVEVDDVPIVVLGLYSRDASRYDDYQLRRVAQEAAIFLQGIENSNQVHVVGGRNRVLQILFKPQQLAARQSTTSNSSLEANLQQAQQQLEEAEIALAYSQIRSPISGRVVERFAEPGDTVQPGQTLLSIYNPKTLWAEANVRETLTLSLQKQQRLTVYIPALNKQLTAKLEEMVPAGHIGSRSFLIKALLPENSQLIPGMFAEAAIAAGEKTQIYLPEDYVSQLGQLALVWVYSDSQLQRRFIRLGEKIALVNTPK